MVQCLMKMMASRRWVAVVAAMNCSKTPAMKRVVTMAAVAVAVAVAVAAGVAMVVVTRRRRQPSVHARVMLAVMRTAVLMGRTRYVCVCV